MANPLSEYIVFEPGQILTNDNLNETFNYLDQQNRWTRNKLIGIGIACGLNISHETGIIQISAGCGVTSQGYLIVQPTLRYAYFIEYSAPDLPNDLPFDYTNQLPFYKPFCTGKTIYLLLTDDEYNALEEAKKASAKTLSSQASDFLGNYAVVLFLEANELDLKNCDTFDCNNKGAEIQFNVRALLVNKKDLPGKEGTNGTKGSTLSHQIKLKRYNVPYTDLNNSVAVINAFTAIVDDATLQQVSNAYNYCYQQYGSLLGVSSNKFANLFKYLQDIRTKILKDYRIFIQYFYDFINDLINAYYEFRLKMSDIITQCCPDENLFPLHLVLGDASIDTDTHTRDSYRTYFIYSPLFSKGANGTDEGLFYYHRMEVIVTGFEVLISSLRGQTQQIKITPSQLGLPLLSERAIPYYYNVLEGVTPLYETWSYYKTSRGNAAFNQSYNAYQYNSSDVMTKPLLYDIEHYNFFRIEGHIGENYQAVLKNILNQRLQYNLPFDVVAISADLLRSNAVLPQCNMQDLETDYKLIISEFACKVHTPFCFLTKFPYPPAKSLSGISNVGGFKNFAAFKMDAVNQFAEMTSVQSLSFSANTYAKGDFMRQYCPPVAKTIGSYYLSILKRGFFSVDSIQSDRASYTNEQGAIVNVYNYILQFVDAVESLMFLLMTKSVATLSLAQLNRVYETYTRTLSALLFTIVEIISKDKTTGFAKELELDILVDEFFLLSTVCLDERLKTLLDEYRRRLLQYQAQQTFINYYKDHPGLEHKAGVPKGGTFVIVYYENPRYKAQDVVTDSRVEIADEKEMMTTEAIQKGLYMDSKSILMIRKLAENCETATDDDKRKIIEIINKQQAVDTRFRVTPGAVIADFYIPYLCCSDCAPIAYIFESTDTGTQFDITPKTFLFDDAHNYPFTAKPPVTNANKEQIDFSSPDIKNPDNLKLLTDESNILYLHPAMDIKSTLSTTLTYKDISVALTIIVPDASFIINPTRIENGVHLQVTAKNQDANNYEWSVNAGGKEVKVVTTQPYQGSFDLPDGVNEFTIQLIITYVINEVTSDDTKLADLTVDLIRNKIASGVTSFEPDYKE